MHIHALSGAFLCVLESFYFGKFQSGNINSQEGGTEFKVFKQHKLGSRGTGSQNSRCRGHLDADVLCAPDAYRKLD